MSKDAKNNFLIPGILVLFLVSIGVFAMRNQEDRSKFIRSYIKDFQLNRNYSEYINFGKLLFPSKFESGSCSAFFEAAYCSSKAQGEWSIQIGMRTPKYFSNLAQSMANYEEQGATVFLMDLRGTQWLLIYNQSDIESLGQHSWLAISLKEDVEYVIDFKFFKDVTAEEQAQLLGFLKTIFWMD